MNHEYFNCNCKKDNCNFCAAGLYLCTICNAAEGELLTNCPGYKLNSEALEACYTGNVIDFTLMRNRVLNGYNIKKRKWT